MATTSAELQVIASPVELRAMALCHTLLAAGEDVPVTAFESYRAAASWLQVWAMRLARDIIADANVQLYERARRIARSLVVPAPTAEQVGDQQQDDGGDEYQVAARPAGTNEIDWA